MRAALAFLTVGAACVALSGCASFGKTMTADDQVKLINALRDAGCKSNFNLAAGAQTASGVSAGGGHAEFAAGGNCDPSTVSKPTPPAQ